MKKHLSMLMLIVALMAPWALRAQSLGDYSFSTGTDATLWVDMSTATNVAWTTSGDYGLTGVQNIGFSFPFGDASYTQYSVNADGNLKLGSTVTGTSNYSSPFSSTNASVNNPKINAFGCDGYAESSHYVKARTIGNSLCVVEICVGTYTSTTRSFLYKWQVQMHSDGTIDIVYPPASGIPSTAPAVSRQCGLCVDASDGWTISATHVATHFTAGTTTTIATGTWPDANRYYRFTRPSLTCPAPNGPVVASVDAYNATLTWSPVGTETEWLIRVNDSAWSSVYDTSYSLTNLTPNTQYTFAVRAYCDVDDTSSAHTITFRTACTPIDDTMIPYTEDFESHGTGTTAFPTCWTKLGSTADRPYINATTSYGHGDNSHGLYFYAAAGGYCYAVMPPLDDATVDINTLQVSFWARQYSTSYNCDFEVGVMTNPTDVSTFVAVDQVHPTGLEYELFDVPLTTYTGSGNYIAFRSVTHSGYTGAIYLMLDDVTLGPLPTCPHPVALTIDEAGTDHVTFSWTATGSESEWLIYLNDSIVDNAYDTTFTLTNLTPNTPYSIGVAAYCGTDDTSTIVSTSIRTQCTYINTLPYSYGFEDMNTTTSSVRPEIPCWNHLNNATSYFGYPYVSSTTPHSGTRNLYWYGSTTTGTYGDYQIVVLPGLDTDVYALNEVLLRFWARPSSTSYYPVFIVGVMTDPTDVNTFTAVQTVNVQNVTDWQEFTVSFANYTGYGNFIAVRMNRPSSSYYAYTDDFTIETIPTCPSVTNLEAQPSTGAAMLTWDVQNDASGTPEGFTVTYDSVNSTGTPTVVTTTEPRIILTGLNAGTEYKVYISADCGTDGEGRTDSITFRTDNLACLGQTEVQMGNSTTGISGCLAYSNWGNTVYQTVWTAAELAAAGLTAGPITAMDLGFTSSTYAKEFTIFLGSTTTSTISDATIASPASHVKVYGPAAHPAGTEGWQHYVFDTAFVWNGTSNIMMTTFMNQPTGVSQTASTGLTGYYVSASNKARYRYRDSQQWTLTNLTEGNAGSTYSYRAAAKFYAGECTGIAACAAPLLTVTDVQSDEVTLSWVPGYDETSWDVDYRVLGASTWTNAATSTSDNSYTITGLTPATEYEFRVGFACSDGDDYYSTVEAMTICLAFSLPYSENFDNITTSTSTSNYGVMPNCWDYTLTATSSTYQTGSYLPGVYYSSTNANSGNYSMRLAGMGYFMLPEMAPSVDSLLVSFNYYITSSSYGLIVGVMEGNTFVPVDTVEMTVSQHTPYEVSFAGYSGTGNRIAFRNTYGSNNSYSYVYIDDIVVDYVPACPRVTGVHVTSITGDGATIHWNDVNGSTYEVEYGHSGYPVGQGTTVTATGDSVVLTGLAASTPYDVYVREMCSEGTAVWSFVRSFRTACAAISQLPYSNDFESEPYYLSGTTTYAQAFPACWTRINDATGTYNYYPYITPTATYVHSGTKGMYWYQTSTSGYAQNEYAILPPVDLTVYDISDLTLSFYCKTTSTSYHPMPIVGVMTDPTDATTFTPVYTFTSTEITTSWQLFSIPLTSYTGTGAYIAIKWPNPNTTSYMAIDDIYLTDEWCDAPLAVGASSTTDEITVHWTPGTATSFTVILGFDTVYNVTDTSYTFTNLTPNTLYNYSVMVECSGTTSMPVGGSIRTQCDALTVLPYVQNFEAAATGGSSSTTWVDCMGRLNNGTTYFGYPYVSSSSTYNHTTGGTKGLYWYNTTTTGTYGDYQIVVLPAVDTTVYPMNTLQLTFWARPSSTSYSPQFQVGVMTDPIDATTFQVVQAVNVMNVTEWQEFTVMLTHYTGQGQYVAIRALRPSSSWYAYVDDITLEQIPSCPPVRDLTVATTAGGAVLTWGIQDGYNEPSGYEVTYRAMTAGATNTVVNTTDPYYVLTGLTTGTTYKAVVRADCDNDGLGRADSVTFTPQVQSYIQVGEGTSTSDALPLNNFWNYSYTQELILASEMNGPATLTGIDFQYAYSSASTVKTNVQIYLATVTQSSLSSAVPYSASTFQQVYSGNLNCSQGWNHFQFTTPYNYNGTGNLLVLVNDNSGDYDGSDYVFYTHSASNMSREAHNDDNAYTLSSGHSETSVLSERANMRLHYSGSANTCVAPRVLAVDVTFDEVTLAWAPGNDETSWDVEYRTSSSSTWITAATGVSTNNYTITGLNPATDYDFRVSYDCTDGNTVSGSVSVATSCVPAALPYTENFDSITTSTSTSNYGVMPACWDYTLTGTSSYTTGSYLPGVYYSSTYANSGSYSMRLGGVGYFMLPEMSVSIDSLILSFSAYTTSTSYGLIVGVMEGNTFVPVDTISMATSQHNNAEVSFAPYQGTGNRIAFRNYYTTSTTTYYSYIYIDDIVVDLIPACPRVTNVTARAIGQTTATIGWFGGMSNYEVEYGPVGFSHGQGTLEVVNSADSIDLVGLAPNTPYDVYVREICSEGSSVWSFVYMFRTACALIDSLPYVEDFETYGTGTTAFPSCWYKLGSTADRPYINATTSYGHNNTYGLYFYAATGGYCYGVMPPVDPTLDLTTMQVNFWARQYSTSYNSDFVVGVMTNPTDTTTFMAIDTVHPAGTTYEEFTVSLANYAGTGNYIAFSAIQHPGTSTAIYMMLDDVTLELLPSCPRVVDVYATNVLTTSATINWTDTSSNSSWYVEYDTVGFTPGTGHMTPIAVTDTFFTLTGLDSGMVYHVYVYPDCNSDIFARELVFTTLAAAPATLPYSCDFEAAGVNGWDLINGTQTNYWMVGNATNNGGNRSLYITNDGTSNAYTITTIAYVFATRTFLLADTGEFAYSYDWKAYGESSFDFIRAALVPAGTQIDAGSYCGFDNASAMPAGGIALDGGYRLNLQSDWQTQMGTFRISQPGTYTWVFMWRNDGSGGTTPPAAIDNVVLMQSTCPHPDNITLSNLTQTSADISWVEMGSASSWEYQLGNGTPVAVTDTTCSLTALNANTDYTFRVRAICGAGDTSLWETYSFHTPCGYITLPYVQDFESETTGSSTTGSAFANCMTRLNNGTSYGGYPYISSSSTYNHTTGGTKGLYWYGSTTATTYGDYQYVILPPIDGTTNPANTLQLSFWAKASSTSYNPVFEVGVMDNPNDTAITVLGTININGSTTWTEYTVMLGSYTGTGEYVAIRALRPSSSWYAYVDDITLEVMPTCPPVQNLHAVSAGTTNIMVDWTDNAGASSWEVSYAPGSATPVVVTTALHPFNITGLSASTAYNVRVRPICSTTDIGEWCATQSFSTSMCDNATEILSYDTSWSTTTSSYAPIGYSFYNYSYVLTLIDSARFAGLQGDITAFAFKPTVTTAGDKFNNMTVWMANVSESTLSTSAPIVPNSTHVFVKVIDNASFNYTDIGWQLHSFDTAFTWDGHSNVLVAVKRDNGSYTSGASFAAHSTSGIKTLYYYQDSGPISYTAPSASSTGSGSYVGDMKFYSCNDAGCPMPALASITHTYNSATVTVSGSGNGFELTYGTDPSNLGNTMTSANGQFTITGLTPATQYFYEVVQLCDSGMVSNATAGIFVTDSLPCVPVTGLAVVATSYDGVTLTWTRVGNENAWEVVVYNTVDTFTYEATGTTIFANGLTSGVTYNANVRPLCGSGHDVEGDWYETPVTFTTDICQPVTNVTVTGVTATTATVSWTAPAVGSGSYRVEYGYTGFDRGQGQSATATATTYTIEGLESMVAYDVYVANICSEALISTWSTVVTFETTSGEGIADVDAEGNLSIYPNPASGMVSISVSEMLAGAEVAIVDLNGRTVATFTLNGTTGTFDVSKLGQGAYFVRLTGEQATTVRKLIVK